MSAAVLIHCDAVHPDRTPPGCRAFYATRTAYADPAYEEAEAVGWTQDVGNIDYCPSCSRAAETCPTCRGSGGWQQPDGLIVECPRGCMTGGAS